MAASLAHRGPDAEGFFEDDRAGFAHRRLSIIDLSEQANQPMYSADGRWVVIFNGELFNYRDVAASLKLPMRTSSDTEVLAESLAREGIQAIHRFNGMFAIAAYNRECKELYLVRDRIGVKPLFYCQAEGNWFFASEMKALLQVDAVRKLLSVDEAALSYYLRLGYIPAPATIWSGIKKFPAGYYLKIGASGGEWTQYWSLTDQIRSEITKNEIEYVNELNSLLTSSVAYRMISDVPYGVLLSGGIDSSLIAAIAQKLASKPIKTFTIGFDPKTHDEAPYARRIAVHLGTEHYCETLTEAEALKLIPDALVLFDEPFADSSALPTLLVSRMARRHVKMVLSGDGGDELFMGYGMYRWIRRLHHPLVRRMRRPLAAVLPQFGDRLRRAARLFENSPALHEHVFSQEQYFFTEKEAGVLLGKAYRDVHLPLPPSTRRPLSVTEKQALFDLSHYLPDDLLVKVDRASMSVALECRTPFLDYRLVSFALNLPETCKMRNGALKILPRKLLRRYLPPELFDRPKKGFSVPMVRWLSGHLRGLMEDLLSEAEIKKAGYLNPEYVLTLKKNFFRGHHHLSQRLWNLMVLQYWLTKRSAAQ